MSYHKYFQRRIATLPASPKLRPGYELIEVQAGQYLLHSGLRSFEINQAFLGLSLPQFLERLTGEQEIDTLLESLNPLQIAFFLDILDMLNKAGLLTSGATKEAGTIQPRYAYHSLLFEHLHLLNSSQQPTELSASDFQDRLKKARVAIIGMGRVGSQLARLLAVTGIGHLTGVDNELVDDHLLLTDAWYDREEYNMARTTAMAQRLKKLNPEIDFFSLPIRLDDETSFPTDLVDHDLLVIASDKPTPSLYHWVNQHCIKTGLPWTSYRMGWDGILIEIGPTVLPQVTACYDCYQQRRHLNSPRPEYDQAIESKLNADVFPLLNLQITPCVSLMCYEIIRFLTNVHPPLTYNAIIEFNVLNGKMIKRPLLKIPRCPTCSRSILEFAPIRFWSELQAERNSALVSETMGT